MKDHDTIQVRLHVPSLPHAEFSVAITREVTKSPGYTNYSNHFMASVYLRRNGHFHTVHVQWGNHNFPDRPLKEEDIKLIMQSYINILSTRYDKDEWQLT